MLIKGKVSILALILHVLLVAVSGAVYWQMSPLFISGEINTGEAAFYIAIPIYILFTIFAVISPFVSIKSIIIDENSISYRYLLARKIFNLKDIEGYFTMDLPSKDATYETIYPVSRNRILPPISSFYSSNYDDLKKAVPLKSMGKVRFSWRNYMLILLFRKYNELDR